MTAMGATPSDRPPRPIRVCALLLAAVLSAPGASFTAAAADIRGVSGAPPAPGIVAGKSELAAQFPGPQPLEILLTPHLPALPLSAVLSAPESGAKAAPTQAAAPARASATPSASALRFSSPPEKPQAPEPEDDLSKLFDGTGVSADTVIISLGRPGESRLTTSLRLLKNTLAENPALRSAVNEGGNVLAALHRSSGLEVFPRRIEVRVRDYLLAQGVNAPFRVDRSGESAWSRISHSVHFEWRLLRDAPKILKECWTVPGKQDYIFLATKTFGLNLGVRLFFAVTAVHAGSLPLLRAVASTTWYQLQDSAFTVFGQTYMKFIGRMTGLLRIGPGYFGDFLFTYIQLTAFEFLNRLVLGPIGENPLVYSWHGMGLIFSNIFMGMISGGPLIPAINKMYQAGVISHSLRMILYQLASLTMLFGLSATFGYQHLYTVLTWSTLLLSWGAYAFFTVFYKPKPGSRRPSGL